MKSDKRKYGFSLPEIEPLQVIAMIILGITLCTVGIFGIWQVTEGAKEAEKEQIEQAQTSSYSMVLDEQDQTRSYNITVED